MAEMADPDGPDGVRMTWNSWPHSKVEASKCVIPIACVYSPIRPSPDLFVLPYSPLRCKSCVCILNPHCRVDFSGKFWICPFCLQRNSFPPHYSMISETNVPAELFPQYTTIEYALSCPGVGTDIPAPPLVFLFVLDTCVIEEELGFVKSALRQALGLIPENALVGLITFGTQVHVHELGFPDLFKTYIFRGTKEIAREQILDQLGLAGQRAAGYPKVAAGRPVVANGRTAASGIVGRFLLSAADCEYTLNSLLDELQSDQWPVQPSNRAARCTGVALSAAAGLLGACVPGTGARIMALVGGPCTEGPGTVGVAEIKVAVERTGGLVVLAESFGHPVFRDSFKRIFEGGPLCADVVIGQGSTTSWKMCGLDRRTCLTVFFDVAPSEKANSAAPGASQHLYIQFLTTYQNPEGQMRLRVSTITRKWVDGSCTEELVAGFDQETSAVVMARLTSLKMEVEEEFDATRWLDRSLIRLCSRFGDYRKDDPASFNLNPSFSIFPQFMFNLRRSQFVQVFNNSPDETAYFRMLLSRENVTNSVVMIQPSLITYSFNSPPSPALLDVASIAADRILLLDAYFSIVVFHGMTVAQWRNMGYQNQPEHQAFAQLLQAPQDDAHLIIKERFPVPRLVVCDQHGSQARFLLAKLNPSATYNSAHDVSPGSDVIFTDDVSLQVFFEHLQRLAVQS
ncbi:unnamed protein product [Victoria cruziana]